MNIKPISKLLHDHGFEYPQLAALQPSDALYTALLVQPTASIQVRDDFIRNTDRVSKRMASGIKSKKT